MKVFIGSDMKLKIIEAYDQKGEEVELSQEELERVEHYLGNLTDKGAHAETEIPPRLLTVLGIQNYGDYFFIVHPDFCQS